GSPGRNDERPVRRLVGSRIGSTGHGPRRIGMPNVSRLQGRLKLRIRTLLLLIAIFAVVLGLSLNHFRREEKRPRWAYEMLNAAELGDVPRIRQLLDEGADVDSVTDGRYPWTPLMYASFKGRTDAARLLLERGADPDHEDLDFYRPITVAAAEGHWDIV